MLEHDLEIGRTLRSSTLEDVRTVIECGRLYPDDPGSELSPRDEFTYRSYLANGNQKDISDLERYLLSMYWRDYLAEPELISFFYDDVVRRAKHVGEIALFANLRSESGKSAVTVAYLGETERYPAHVRLGVQRANFHNTIGLSGLTRVRLGLSQRVALDSDGRVLPGESRPANVTWFNPFIVEHVKLYHDLRTVVERRDFRVGLKEIKEWTVDHPIWEEYVEAMVYALTNDMPNPHPKFKYALDGPEPWTFNGISAEGMDFERNTDL